MRRKLCTCFEKARYTEENETDTIARMSFALRIARERALLEPLIHLYGCSDFSCSKSFVPLARLDFAKRCTRYEAPEKIKSSRCREK